MLLKAVAARSAAMFLTVVALLASLTVALAGVVFVAAPRQAFVILNKPNPGPAMIGGVVRGFADLCRTFATDTRLLLASEGGYIGPRPLVGDDGKLSATALAEHISGTVAEAIDPLKTSLAEMHQEPAPDDPLVASLRQIVDGGTFKPGDVILMDRDGDKWTAAHTDSKAIVDREMRAEMAQALAASIERPLNGAVGGLQIGSIAVGGFTGLLLGEIVDGLVPSKNSNVLAKAGVVLVLNQMGTKLMSKQGVNFAIAVLVLQAAADVLPLNQWIERITSALRISPMAQARQITHGYTAPQLQGPGLVHPAADELHAALNP